MTKKVWRLFILILAITGLCACSSLPNPLNIFTKKGRPVEDPKPPPLSPNFGPNQIEGGPFKDRTADYGLSGIEANHLYAVDFNNDGFTDLVLIPQFYDQPQFWQYDPKKKKFIKLEYNPFPDKVSATYLAFADFNKDSILDVLVGTMAQKTELNLPPMEIFRGEIDARSGKLSYREIQGAFGNSKKYAGAASLSLLDFDLDGELDIYLGNWFDFSQKTLPPLSDELLKGKVFKFSNQSDHLENEQYFSRSTDTFINARPTFATSICDVDQDGWPDILTCSSGGFHNKLWQNRPDSGRERFFKDIAKETNYASDQDGALSTMGGGNNLFASCADYNNDGIMDIFLGELSHSYDPPSRDRTSILTGISGQGVRYNRQELFTTAQGQDRADRRALWVDFNNDGLLDLVVENSSFPPNSRLTLMQQEQNGDFVDISANSGIDIVNPMGVIMLDLNNDGAMDLLVGQAPIRDTRIAARLYYFENVGHTSGKSLRLHLQGESSNTLALGATVILKSKLGKKRAYVDYLLGAQSQNQEGIHFGLSLGDVPQTVEVHWPYLPKGQGDESTPLVKRYRVPQMKGNYSEFTLCESGKILLGNKKCSAR
ncbi:MAG: CRTAC1 family protein [Pseudomonadota bacterium]